MKFHISQPDSIDGTNLNIEAPHLDKATEVAMSLIRGGFFEKDRSVDIAQWVDKFGSYEPISSVIIFGALRAREEGA